MNNSVDASVAPVYKEVKDLIAYVVFYLQHSFPYCIFGLESLGVGTDVSVLFRDPPSSSRFPKPPKEKKA